MVWPVNWLPSSPAAVVPSGYAVRRCAEQDLSAVRTLIDSDLPITDKAWEYFLDRVLPGGAFLIAHAESGEPAATASAVHNPRAARHYFPFGGEVGYVVAAPGHRGRGLGRAVVSLVVTRLLEAGYRHIFVGVQGWRLPAVKCYLSLGFVPLLHADELLPRWRRVCEQIGWPVRDSEWPRTLAAVTEGAAEPGALHLTVAAHQLLRVEAPSAAAAGELLRWADREHRWTIRPFSSFHQAWQASCAIPSPSDSRWLPNSRPGPCCAHLLHPK
jgi:mycothiol synthase